MRKLLPTVAISVAFPALLSAQAFAVDSDLDQLLSVDLTTGAVPLDLARLACLRVAALKRVDERVARRSNGSRRARAGWRRLGSGPRPAPR